MMSDNRIQINGIWYVREDSLTDALDHLEDEEMSGFCSDSMETCYENDTWCFNASILLQEDAESLNDTFGDPWIEVIDKRSKNVDTWIKHSCDNVNWFYGVIDGTSESMEDAYKMFDAEGLRRFRSFLRTLETKGWLVKKDKK
jgi:hypothetical protein